MGYHSVAVGFRSPLIKYGERKTITSSVMFQLLKRPAGVVCFVVVPAVSAARLSAAHSQPAAGLPGQGLLVLIRSVTAGPGTPAGRGSVGTGQKNCIDS